MRRLLIICYLILVATAWAHRSEYPKPDPNAVQIVSNSVYTNGTLTNTYNVVTSDHRYVEFSVTDSNLQSVLLYVPLTNWGIVSTNCLVAKMRFGARHWETTNSGAKLVTFLTTNNVATNNWREADKFEFEVQSSNTNWYRLVGDTFNNVWGYRDLNSDQLQSTNFGIMVTLSNDSNASIISYMDYLHATVMMYPSLDSDYSASDVITYNSPIDAYFTQTVPPCFAWLDSSNVYMFHHEQNGRPLIYRSVDAGSTWGDFSENEPYSYVNAMPACWRSQWTPGSTGEVTHLLVANGQQSNAVYYSAFNETNGGLPTFSLIYTNEANSRHYCSISESTDGDIWVANSEVYGGVTGTVVRSQDAGSTWSTNLNLSHFHNQNSPGILPLKHNDMLWVVVMNDNSDYERIEYKRWDDSATAWGTTYEITHTWLNMYNGSAAFDFCQNPETYEIHLAVLADQGDASQNAILHYTYNADSDRFRALPYIVDGDDVGDKLANLERVQIVIEKNTHDLYCFFSYSGDPTGNDNICYRRSTDSGRSWEKIHWDILGTNAQMDNIKHIWKMWDGDPIAVAWYELTWDWIGICKITNAYTATANTPQYASHTTPVTYLDEGRIPRDVVVTHPYGWDTNTPNIIHYAPFDHRSAASYGQYMDLVATNTWWENAGGFQTTYDALTNAASSVYGDGSTMLYMRHSQQAQDATNLSIGCWFVADSTSDWGYVFNAWNHGNDPTGQSKVAIFVTNDSVGVKMSDGSVASTLVANTVINTSLWYHVMATYDGSTAILYVDGEEDTQAVFNLDLNTWNGQASNKLFEACDGSGDFGGYIDDTYYAIVPIETNAIYGWYTNSSVIRGK